MQRRQFLRYATSAAAAEIAWWTLPAAALDARPAHRQLYQNLLIWIELKGGNDALNTVVPYADPTYSALRPKLALKPDQVLQLDDHTGLHPNLQALMPIWQAGQLAVVQGLGYPQPNLSHFRSIEIWDTASDADDFLQEGWLSRVFSSSPLLPDYVADAVLIGSNDLGPLAGHARAIALPASDNATQQFVRQVTPQMATVTQQHAALAHLLKVQADLNQAAAGFKANLLSQPYVLPDELAQRLPVGAWGDAIKTALQVVGGGRQASTAAPVACVRLTLNGFDTHHNQLAAHAKLMTDLGEGLAVLRDALIAMKRWDKTLVATYSEFGRRPRENQSGGTDHGTAAAHFVLGGKVQGGLYGARPALQQLDSNGNLGFSIDFRRLYATFIEAGWGLSSQEVLGGKFTPLSLIRS